MAQQIEYQYKHRRVILTNEIQEQTLKTMESYGVNISQFIRLVIKEFIGTLGLEVQQVKIWNEQKGVYNS